MSAIRGHQAQFRAYKDGGDLQIINIKSVDVNQVSTFIKSMYVGAKHPVGDQSFEGFEGSLELEVEDATVDEFIDALVTDNLNGIGVGDYSFSITDNYDDGSSKSYVYMDCQWKLGKKIGGLNEKVTQRLEFQAMRREAL